MNDNYPLDQQFMISSTHLRTGAVLALAVWIILSQNIYSQSSLPSTEGPFYFTPTPGVEVPMQPLSENISADQAKVTATKGLANLEKASDNFKVAKKRIEDAQAQCQKIVELKTIVESQKQSELDDLRNNRFCVGCNATKTMIEAKGIESWETHLKNVGKGTYGVSAETIAQKSHQYDKRLNELSEQHLRLIESLSKATEAKVKAEGGIWICIRQWTEAARLHQKLLVEESQKRIDAIQIEIEESEKLHAYFKQKAPPIHQIKAPNTPPSVKDVQEWELYRIEKDKTAIGLQRQYKERAEAAREHKAAVSANEKDIDAGFEKVIQTERLIGSPLVIPRWTGPTLTIPAGAIEVTLGKDTIDLNIAEGSVSVGLQMRLDRLNNKQSVTLSLEAGLPNPVPGVESPSVRLGIEHTNQFGPKGLVTQEKPILEVNGIPMIPGEEQSMKEILKGMKEALKPATWQPPPAESMPPKP
jgi:hypothetical protein